MTLETALKASRRAMRAMRVRLNQLKLALLSRGPQVLDLGGDARIVIPIPLDREWNRLQVLRDMAELLTKMGALALVRANDDKARLALVRAAEILDACAELEELELAEKAIAQKRKIAHMMEE